jgi:shikimate kinase
MKSKVLIVGLAGAGTSTVGAALATRLGWPYVDAETMLLRTTGRSASELRTSQGEDALRAAERRVLTLMLGMPGPMVGGLPSGIVDDERDRTRLTTSEAHVVWLRVSAGVLARRLAQAAGRVKQGTDLDGSLTALAAERDRLFEQVADQVVDTDAIPAGAVAKLVVAAIDPSDRDTGGVEG